MTDIQEQKISISSWLGKLFSTFSQEYYSLSHEEQSKLSNLDDLSSPCQVEVLWISKPSWKLDYQVLIFTHFKDLGEQDITIYGPIAPEEALKKMECIIREPKWQREIDQKESFYSVRKGTSSYASMLEIPFAHTLRSIQGYALRDLFSEQANKLRIGEKSALSKDSFYWLVPGNICELDIDEIVQDIIKGAKMTTSVKSQPPKIKSRPINGFVTYFYPPIWVGELPQKTLKERLTGARPVSLIFSEKALDAEYKNAKVVVNQGGLIAIGIEDKMKALDALNEIMAAALLSGIQSFAVRESELGKAGIDPQTLAITVHDIPLVSMRTKLEEEHIGLSPELFPSERRVLLTDDIKKILKLAEELAPDQSSSTVLLMLLEGYTHLQNTEYTQSFLMTWIVIEKWLDSLWEGLVQEKSIKGKRRKKLVESTLWTADTILETLNLVGSLSESAYREVTRLKRLRNNILHAGVRVAKTESEACINLASRLLMGKVV
ncbi:hypothetical protein ACFLY3_00660 [Chloroflexota bacterium]